MALKTFNPTTPGRRGLVLVDRSGLWKGKPVKKLTEGLDRQWWAEQSWPRHRETPWWWAQAHLSHD